MNGHLHTVTGINKIYKHTYFQVCICAHMFRVSVSVALFIESKKIVIFNLPVLFNDYFLKLKCQTLVLTLINLS